MRNTVNNELIKITVEEMIERKILSLDNEKLTISKNKPSIWRNISQRLL